ncbi:carbohydrate ABC transporter membrane protein 2 (CUT1 family) [Anaerobacterium chartisolvens]|uniref:Carbohydrate ABC transporter membrane protein 2 (CUT1 family) n=1 Tax=Anaerobacterium chartisolvens TaxID=1297424 RepID=A0A369BDW5_9FIRM|nr:carbohydrate ABC transporter permease [Anaerobacterium chartisolvens]RCX18798.1 carbohydrate ABC transporter membrane protein 2 (CUT1 family) [Anaerobacterium chartisolvens]
MNQAFLRKLHKILIEIIMWVISLVVLIPLLIVLFGSLKSAPEAAHFNIIPPLEWHFENYIHVIKTGGLINAAKNSILITFFSIALIILVSVMCSFIIARRTGRYSSIIYNIFLMGMIAPMQLITTFGLLKVLNLMGTYSGVILIFSATQIPWAVFMLTSFMKTIPREMDEAAFIDGAGPIKMVFVIIMPLLKPVIATTIVILSMSVWNDLMIPLFFLNSSSKWTMPLTVYNFFGQYFSNWNYVFADLVLTALPVVILYLFFQRYVIAGMTAGAVKG